MLTNADNELMCRVGRGTPMGEVLREYWLPVFFPSELEADGPPLRIRALGGQGHLGTSDIMIIRTRLRLMRAAQALRERQEIPPGVDQPEFYRQRSGGVILPRSVDWFEATRDLRKAFVEYPEAFVLETIGERRKA